MPRRARRSRSSVDGHAAAGRIAQDVDGGPLPPRSDRPRRDREAGRSRSRCAVSNSSPSRTERIGDAVLGHVAPFSRTRSPGRTRARAIRTHAPEGRCPIPVVLMKIAVALAAVHDLRVARDDRHVEPRARHRASSATISASSWSIGRPSSRMKPAAERQRGRRRTSRDRSPSRGRRASRCRRRGRTAGSPRTSRWRTPLAARLDVQHRAVVQVLQLRVVENAFGKNSLSTITAGSAARRRRGAEHVIV